MTQQNETALEQLEAEIAKQDADWRETVAASFEAGEQIVLTGTSDNIDWEGPAL